MNKIIGGFFIGAAISCFAVFGIWGFILDLRILNEVGGFWLTFLGFTIFPATFVFAPWYAGIAWGVWLPLQVSYGGGILGFVLLGIGMHLQGSE